MILDFAFFLSRKLVVAVLRARWRDDTYGWGGRAWTGAA